MFSRVHWNQGMHLTERWCPVTSKTYQQPVGLKKHFYFSGYSLTKLLGVPTVGKFFFLGAEQTPVTGHSKWFCSAGRKKRHPSGLSNKKKSGSKNCWLCLQFTWQLEWHSAFGFCLSVLDLLLNWFASLCRVRTNVTARVKNHEWVGVSISQLMALMRTYKNGKNTGLTKRRQFTN